MIKNETSKPVCPTNIKGYAVIIWEATGITDPLVLAEIEDIMRHDIYHSTLDWQTRDQLKNTAIEALEIIKELKDY